MEIHYAWQFCLVGNMGRTTKTVAGLPPPYNTRIGIPYSKFFPHYWNVGFLIDGEARSKEELTLVQQLLQLLGNAQTPGMPLFVTSYFADPRTV